MKVERRRRTVSRLELQLCVKDTVNVDPCFLMFLWILNLSFLLSG